MNNVRCTVAAVLIMMVVLSGGCSKKQKETTADKQGARQGQTGAPGVPEQTKSDVRAAAKQVVARLQAGDFPAIYRESAPGFKKIGSEAQFVTKFQQARMKTGVQSNPQELSFDTRPGNAYVLVFRMNNERYTTDWRLTFARNQAGGYELAGLNQHDELKK